MISIRDLHKRDKGICHICRKYVNLRDATREHLVPKAYGGTNDRTNIALAHKWCNKVKGDKIFRAEQHGTGYVVVDPNGKVSSDEYPTYVEAYAVARDMNEDRLYMDSHYENISDIERKEDDIIVVKKNVSDSTV